MSRSRKKTPVSGHTGAESEKDDKRQANRALRRQSREVLDTCEDYDSLVMPNQDETSSVWSFAKDGKVYWKDIPDKFRRK